jgi:Holliday junction DNA helicase RuvA
MAADAMVAAIRSNDIARLTKIPGIGKKTAERMVLELRDKLPVATSATVLPTLSAVEDDVLSALLNLGYQRAAAESALEKAPKNSQSFDVIFREALAALTR